MAMIQVNAWQCDVCGHIWLKEAGKVPTHCASTKCRSRQWNRSQAVHTAKVEKFASGVPKIATPRLAKTLERENEVARKLGLNYTEAESTAHLRPPAPVGIAETRRDVVTSVPPVPAGPKGKPDCPHCRRTLKEWGPGTWRCDNCRRNFTESEL